MSSSVPVALFSITTSARSIRRRTSSSPRACFRFTPKPRFERLDEAKEALICVDITTRMKSG
jgi:hypothetical protein